MRTISKVIIFFTVMAISAPFSLLAGQASLEQVKQNVHYLHKTVMDGQPHVSAKKFKEIIASDDKFVLLDVCSPMSKINIVNASAVKHLIKQSYDLPFARTVALLMAKSMGTQKKTKS